MKLLGLFKRLLVFPFLVCVVKLKPLPILVVVVHVVSLVPNVNLIPGHNSVVQLELRLLKLRVDPFPKLIWCRIPFSP